MRNKNLKGLFILISVIMFMPFVQQVLPYVTSGPLQGYYSNAGDTDFAWEKWLDGSYQKMKNDYCNDHIGFRPDLVRLNGQIDFSLFHKADYGGAVVGSDNSIYYSEYIDAYFGENYLGYDTIRAKLVKLKAIQDTLARLGKSLILIHEPCKAFYNAESITDLKECTPKRPTNYQIFLQAGDSLGINQVDLNSWFVSMKKNSKELLFSKQGIHWTVYGSILGSDSIAKYIEHLRNIKMPHVQLTKIEHTTKARETDDDMAKVLNLILPVATETYCYPELHYVSDSTTTKPNIIYIGDSFIWNLISNGFMKNANSDWEFWFYFRDIHKGNENPNNIANRMQEGYDWKSKLNNADCILLMYTSAQLHKIGGGFIEQAYDHYYSGKNSKLAHP